MKALPSCFHCYGRTLIIMIIFFKVMGSIVALCLDSVEVKPAVTRKLRRRPNDPLPAPEKRRKTSHILLIQNIPFNLSIN